VTAVSTKNPLTSSMANRKLTARVMSLATKVWIILSNLYIVLYRNPPNKVKFEKEIGSDLSKELWRAICASRWVKGFYIY
jgi:hypothetical protein